MPTTPSPYVVLIISCGTDSKHDNMKQFLLLFRFQVRKVTTSWALCLGPTAYLGRGGSNKLMMRYPICTKKSCYFLRLSCWSHGPFVGGTLRTSHLIFNESFEFNCHRSSSYLRGTNRHGNSQHNTIPLDTTMRLSQLPMYMPSKV